MNHKTNCHPLISLTHKHTKDTSTQRNEICVHFKETICGNNFAEKLLGVFYTLIVHSITHNEYTGMYMKQTLHVSHISFIHI